jgi:hypothetical protein
MRELANKKQASRSAPVSGIVDFGKAPHSMGFKPHAMGCEGSNLATLRLEGRLFMKPEVGRLRGALIR